MIEDQNWAGEAGRRRLAKGGTPRAFEEGTGGLLWVDDVGGGGGRAAK